MKKRHTPEQWYLLMRMAQGWTILQGPGGWTQLRDSRDVNRKPVYPRTLEVLLREGWITRTRIDTSVGNVRYKITGAGRTEAGGKL